MRAADLFEQGMIPAEIARQVGVRHQIVSEGARRGGGLAATACVVPDVRDGSRS